MTERKRRDMETAEAHAMSSLPGRGHPRHSLHAVLRKFRKAEAAASTPPETITFEADGTTKVAVVGPPAVPVKDAMIREFEGVQYAILIPLGSIPGYPDAHYIARPVAAMTISFAGEAYESFQAWVENGIRHHPRRRRDDRTEET